MVTHTSSWYAASLPDHLNRVRQSLRQDLSCDVCVVGGGFAGVSAAYHLARAGQRVVLLEAQRIGWGASGRNGGQLHPGLRKDLQWFDKTMGRTTARRVHEASLASLAHFNDLITHHAMPCDRRDGLLTACRSKREIHEEIEASQWANQHFGATALVALDAAETEDALGTDRYPGAVRETDGGHIHPLRFVMSLAQAAEESGAIIHDQTSVVGIAQADRHVRIETETHSVKADHVVLAGNGYMRGLSKTMDSKVLPITNFLVATKPIGAGQPGGVLASGEAAADTRFVVRYWRPTSDGRLIFGGGEKFSTAFPADIASFVRSHLLEVYPRFKDVEIDHAWGGTLAVTQNRLPLIRKVDKRIFCAAGFSGQGVLAAPFAGKIIADALTHDPALLDLFSSFPCPRFPGGAALRAPILFLAMSYFALRDRIG